MCWLPVGHRPTCNRSWVEELFRDMKSRLGLNQAAETHEERLNRLLMGYQVAHFLVFLVGLRLPKRWRRYFLATGYVRLPAD